MSDTTGGANQEADDQVRMHPRAARVKLAHAQDYLDFLGRARRAKHRLDGDTTSLDREILTARDAVV